jgi:hypothetical protein
MVKEKRRGSVVLSDKEGSAGGVIVSPLQSHI